MIKTWRTSATRRFAEEGKSKFSGMDERKARRRLNLLDSISDLKEIAPLNSIHIHPLKGSRKGQWAMTINDQWRLVFTFKGGDAYDVEIVDYH
jgi:proteic killer suppression protein